MPARTTRAQVEADPDVEALANNATARLWARTGNGTGAARTLTAGTGVSVANGNGQSGNPTVSIGQAVATTDTPAFRGVTLAPASGGTGKAISSSQVSTTSSQAGPFAYNQI